jgi:hypothetical protein
LRDEQQLKLVKDNFVAVAVDTRPMQHRQDAEGEFYRQLAKQAGSYAAGFGGASGGEYVITAGGKMLSKARVGSFVKGLEEFKKLPEADRKPPVGELGKIDPKWPVPSAGGLVVRVYQTRMERDRQEDLCQPAKFRSFSWGCYEPGRDSVWLTEAECRSLVPAGLQKGDRFPFPPTLGDRIARSALRDMSETNGVTWDANAVRSLQWTLTVEDVSASLVRLSLKGSVSLRNDPLHAQVEYTKALAIRSRAGERFQAAPSEEESPAPRFDARVLGYLTYDREKRVFTRFDVVALGDYAGICINPDYAKPGQPYYYVIRSQPQGIALEIAPPGQAVLPLVRWRELYSGF